MIGLIDLVRKARSNQADKHSIRRGARGVLTAYHDARGLRIGSAGIVSHVDAHSITVTVAAPLSGSYTLPVFEGGTIGRLHLGSGLFVEFDLDLGE